MSASKLLLGRIAFVAWLACLGITAGCNRGPRPSPTASASCDLGGGKTISTVYSSPRMKGRRIYGDLVPFGKVWRAGANEATTFVTSSDLVVGGATVPTGKYTIFIVPEADKWILIINKKTGEWGIPYKYENDELTRVGMKLSTLPSPVEDFTIGYDKSAGACMLRMDWETTRASVDIRAK